MNKTIELRSFSQDQHDVSSSTSRAPLVKKIVEEYKTSNVQLKVEREFRKLNSIINLKKCIMFIYQCLFFDVLSNFYSAYLVIAAITDIIHVELSPLYLFEYGISLWNAVLYIKIIIQYKEFHREEERKKEEEAFKNEKKKVKIENEESLLDVTIYLNKPIQGIRHVMFFRFLTWHFKLVLYIIIIGIRSSFNAIEYLSIPVLLVDYFLYHVLKFYYKVLLRIEAYKTLYKLEEPE